MPVFVIKNNTRIEKIEMLYKAILTTGYEPKDLLASKLIVGTKELWWFTSIRTITSLKITSDTLTMQEFINRM